MSQSTHKQTAKSIEKEGCEITIDILSNTVGLQYI